LSRIITGEGKTRIQYSISTLPNKLGKKPPPFKGKNLKKLIPYSSRGNTFDF
jgi:hypothetical protein